MESFQSTFSTTLSATISVTLEKQTGAETAYAKHTKRVLELTLVGVEKEGTHGL